MTTAASDDDLVGAGIIWSFWEGQTPDLVLRCFESIRIHNPTRPFIILNRATLPKFVDLTVDFPLFRGKRGTPDDFFSVQIFADWVRLKLLDKYGGVWLDASIICTSPVDNWIANGDHNNATAAALLYDDDEDEMQIQQLGSVKNIIHMFPMHANPNVHASWAMAAMEPGNPVIQAWLQEMNDIFNEIGSPQEPLDYIKRVMTENNEVCERWNTPHTPPLPYLWVYLALQVVLHRQPDLHSHICLHSSVDGPMYRRYMYNVEHKIQDATEVSRATADHLAMEPPNIEGSSLSGQIGSQFRNILTIERIVRIHVWISSVSSVLAQLSMVPMYRLPIYARHDPQSTALCQIWKDALAIAVMPRPALLFRWMMTQMTSRSIARGKHASWWVSWILRRYFRPMATLSTTTT